MRARYVLILAIMLCILGRPSIAAAQDVPPLSAYGSLPAIEDVAVSPSGRNIAMVKNVAGERAIILLREDLSVRNAIKIGDLKVRWMRFIGDDGLLVLRSKTQRLGRRFVADKTEVSQAMVLSVEDLSEPGVVFGNQASIENRVVGSYGVRQIGSSTKAYFGGIEFARHPQGHYYYEHGRPSLFEIDLKTMKPKRVDKAASPTRYKNWVIDANGQIAATLWVNREDGKWFTKNSEGAIVAEGRSPTGGVGLLGLSEDGSALLYLERADVDGSVNWYKVPLDGSGTAVPFLKDVDVERLFWDRSTGHLMGYFDDDPGKPVVFFNPKNKRVAGVVRKAFEGMDARIVEWTDDFRKFVVRTRGNSNSGIWFLVDLDKGGAVPIGDERPTISGNAVGPISTVVYTAQDGLEMDGVLTLPPGKEPKNLPVVIMPHGGPNSRNIETFHWRAQAFASRGYAVFQPNFRGSTNRDDEFIEAGNGQWGRKMQTDISDGLAALAQTGTIDPSRACIVGSSYGGYAALAGVTIQNGLYRCAVAIAPVTDISTLYKQDLRERGSRQTAKRALLRQLGDPSGFDEVSPYRLAKKADAPVLLIHGKDDTVVPYKQSTMMADALKDEGKPYELVTLDGEDHWLSQSETRQQMLRSAIQFVQKHNPAD